MFHHKARKYLGFILVCMLLIGLIACNRQSSSGSDCKTIRGTIIAYEETENGLVAVLDAENRSSDVRVRFLEETMWFGDDALRARIEARETGIFVTVLSEYPTKNFDNIYPVTGINEGWTR